MPRRRTNPYRNHQPGWLPLLVIVAGLAALPLLLVFDRAPQSDIHQVRHNGKLRVLTIEGPTTYYHTADGPSGFEYDLLSAFAAELGVSLELETADSLASVFPRLERGDAHFAAALKITAPRRRFVRFSTPYQEIDTRVVYRRGDRRPLGFTDLVDREITVPAGSSYAQLLSARKAELPALSWSESSSRTTEDLLVDVWEEEIEITFAPSNLLAIVRQHYPELRVGFSLETPQELAWAFRPGDDGTLLAAANEFLETMRGSGELARLIDRYYGAATKFDYVNVRTFRDRVSTVLPRFEALFREAAAEYDLDWRLVAAQAYQESYWRPGAESPTGVEGLMQLTRATAEFMDVDDRRDPRQSVMGGARYLRNLHNRIDEAVTEPDRTWFALAAYNVGLGHLLDARALAREQGKDPDQWTNVKPMLERLSEPEWYRRTRYGRARGYEAVAYVTRIRSFYDILTEMKADPLQAGNVRILVPAL